MDDASQVLAALRRDLDFLPSPVEDRPGLLIRDSFQFSDATLIIPPPLVPLLEMFDGASTERDLKTAIYEMTGELNTQGLVDHLRGALSQAGFLDDGVYRELRDARHREFAAAPLREAAFAGSAYPEELPELEATFERYFAGSARAESQDANLLGIAAPHVSPEGGWETYRAAFQALPASMGGRTFVVLGTSHYGQPDRFGLTRKNYRTPLGEAITDVAEVDALRAAAPDSVVNEDYCHAVEHSIEFQILFLQRMFGPDVKVLPVLCGAFFEGLYKPGGRRPEESEEVRRFLGELGELAARRRDLAWVLGVDMAHMGRRYGDQFDAYANRAEMVEVARRDRARMESMMTGRSDEFWEQVRENQDDLKWCGSAPIYTFMASNPRARGEMRHYQQWNIDPHSVVSFAALTFHVRS